MGDIFLPPAAAGPHAATHAAGESDELNHDDLAGFLPAEHIDWAVTGAEQVHADRYATGTGGATNTVTGGTGITNTGDNTNAVLEPTFGITTNTLIHGNDARLSDARTPTAHAHPQSDITDLVADLAAKAETTDARFPTAPEKAALAGTGTPAVGNPYVSDDDSRMTDARAPTAHTHPLSEVTDSGTAAAEDIGTAIGDAVGVIDVGGAVPGLPVLDGSNLTGVTAAGTMAFEDEGVPVAGGPHDTANYIGSGVTVADAGGGTVTVTIAAGAAPIDTVFSRTGTVVAVAGDYTAAEVTNVAAGSIAGVTVQAAIDELDTEKAPVVHVHEGADLDSTGEAIDRVLVTDGADGFAYEAKPTGGGTPATTVATSDASAGVVGTDTEYARQDHEHQVVTTGTPGTSTPGDTAAPGASDSLARVDHQHALPAFGTTAGTFGEGDAVALNTAKLTATDGVNFGQGIYTHVGGALEAPGSGQWSTNNTLPASATVIRIHSAGDFSAAIYEMWTTLQVGDFLQFSAPRSTLIAGDPPTHNYKVDGAVTDNAGIFDIPVVTAGGNGGGFEAAQPYGLSMVRASGGVAHRTGSGADHADVAANTLKVSYTDGAAVALNTTHRSSDGTDHANVLLNDAHRALTAPHIDWAVTGAEQVHADRYTPGAGYADLAAFNTDISTDHVANVTVGTVAPGSPINGDVWIDTNP